MTGTNFSKLVGVLGVEPRTSSLSGTRSNQLSYTPIYPKSLFLFLQVLSNLLVQVIFGGAEGARTLDILLAKQVL